MPENLKAAEPILNIEAEEAVLGSVLVNPTVFDRVSNLLTEKCFSIRRNRWIWQAFETLKRQKRDIDFLTVSGVLSQNTKLEEAGGDAYLTGLIANVPTSLHAVSYAQQVLNAAFSRSLIDQAGKIAKLAGEEGDPHEKIMKARAFLEPLKTRTAAVSPMDLISSDTLLSSEWPEPEWAIPDLLPAGLTVFAGKSKLGKSWLMLQAAHGIGAGGRVFDIGVEKRSVLYLALEDPPRRLQERMKKQHWPAGLSVDFLTIGSFMDQVGDLKNCGGERLAAQIKDRKYGMVVIDTLSRSVYGDQDNVEAMTRALEPVQEVAHDANCAIVMVDHHRKVSSNNPDAIIDILGSTAKGAVADTAWGIYRDRGSSKAKLQITGRDVIEHNLALTWDGLTCTWQTEGDADMLKLTERRREILDAVADLEPCSVRDVCEAIDQDRSNTYRRMMDLEVAGLITKRKEGQKYIFELRNV